MVVSHICISHDIVIRGKVLCVCLKIYINNSDLLLAHLFINIAGSDLSLDQRALQSQTTAVYPRIRYD